MNKQERHAQNAGLDKPDGVFAQISVATAILMIRTNQTDFFEEAIVSPAPNAGGPV